MQVKFPFRKRSREPTQKSSGHAVKTKVPGTPHVSRRDTPCPVGPGVSAGPPRRAPEPKQANLNPRPLRAARARDARWRCRAHRPVADEDGGGPLVTRAAPWPHHPTPRRGHFRELPRRSGDPRGEPPVAAGRGAPPISAMPGGQYTVKAPPASLLVHSIPSPLLQPPCTLAEEEY